MYKAVLVGLGNIAWRLGRDSRSGSSLSHKDSFDQNHKVKLIAGYAPDDREVQDFVQNCGVKGYVSLSQMLEQESPDIVSICSPQEYHAEQLEKCFNYKVPMVWLEKPATVSVAETKKLENLRGQMLKSSTVLVNFQRRYTESYQRLKQLIQEEVYGRSISVEIHYSRGLVLNGSHMVDMLVYLFPESKFELLWVERYHKLDNPDFVVRLSDRLVAHVIGVESTFHNIDVRVTCEQARLSIEHGGMTVRIEEVRENHLFSGYYRLYDKESGDLGAPGFDHAFDKALEDLIESFEQEHQPNSNLMTAFKSQALIEGVVKQNTL
jgi:predicted dehydrogenase